MQDFEQLAAVHGATEAYLRMTQTNRYGPDEDLAEVLLMPDNGSEHGAFSHWSAADSISMASYEHRSVKSGQRVHFRGKVRSTSSKAVARPLQYLHIQSQLHAEWAANLT